MAVRELSHNALSEVLQDVPTGQVFVLADANTAAHCLPILLDFIGDITYHLLTIEAGEKNKTLGAVQQIWDFLLEHHATRQAVLINLGGGVITDLGGFAAASYMRGIRFVNIPTTLLSMVDASTGGKTGFDYRGVKNIIGTFSPAAATFVHPDFLCTLPNTELLSGLAEMLKHALIASHAEWIHLLQLAQDELAEQELKAALSSGLIASSIAIKEAVVEQDPNEGGLRKILNFGHTVGHAIESSALAQEKELPHGYCVLWGMVAEVYLSVVHAGCPREVLQHLTQLMLEYYGRPACNCKQREELLERMYQDKKNAANKPLILLYSKM